MLKKKKTDPDHLNMNGQYAENTASLFEDIVKTIPYDS